MPSANYRLIRRAIETEQQITCSYQGHDRELCPHIIGHTNGEERLLAYQFGGSTSGVLPPGGAWKCLDVAKMTGIAARAGRWHSGASHQKEQSCVREIDLDINVHVRTGAR
jgi:hypothetical protein